MVPEDETSVPTPETKGARTTKKRKKTTHTPQHTEREKEIFMWFKNFRDPKTGKRVFTYDMIGQAPHAPKPRTLRRWIKEKQQQPTLKKPKLHRGPPPALTEVEKLILGGWAISTARNGEAVTMASIQAFVVKAFGVHIGKSWVSKTMHSLGFSSRTTQETDLPRNDPQIAWAMIKFLERCRAVVPSKYEPSRVVVMDVKSFWTSGPVLRSYSPKGTGKPPIRAPTRKWKDLMYTSICGDGTVLPPVIITSDTKLKNLDYSPGKVVLIPRTKGESNNATLAWIDQIKEYLEDKPLLLMDNHRSHHQPEFREVLKSYKISPRYFPPKCGSLLSPLDNSFHAELWKRYVSKPRRSHEEQIQAMIAAYYEVPEENIKNYWKHTGILASTTPGQVVRQLLSEGYFNQDSQHCRDMVHAYWSWKELRRTGKEEARNLKLNYYLLKAGLENYCWREFQLG